MFGNTISCYSKICPCDCPAQACTHHHEQPFCEKTSLPLTCAIATPERRQIFSWQPTRHWQILDFSLILLTVISVGTLACAHLTRQLHPFWLQTVRLITSWSWIVLSQLRHIRQVDAVHAVEPFVTMLAVGGVLVLSYLELRSRSRSRELDLLGRIRTERKWWFSKGITCTQHCRAASRAWQK